MLRNHLISGFRILLRNKAHAFINVTGLTIGLATSLLALLFILDEVSFDRFHQNKDRLYRLNKISVETRGGTVLTAESSGLMGPTMVDEFQEVEKVMRFEPWFNEVVLSHGERNLLVREGEVAFADSTFFEVFDFELISGDPKRVLSRPSTMVITEETAKALFGNEDPVGKTVTGLGDIEYEITGIAKAAPRNSHIQFKGLISWVTSVPSVGAMPMDFMNNWIAQSICTYVLVKEGANVAQLQRKFPDFMRRHMPTRVDKYQLYLQPFGEIYLRSGNVESNRVARSGNMEYVYIFSIIAGFLLLIACVNYININTSKATRRAREVGMRKSVGASRLQLIYQFLGESFLITAVSGLLAVLLADLFIPYFNNLAGKSLEGALLFDHRVVLGLVVLIVTVSLISGSYPAFLLSGFRPAEILKTTSPKMKGHLPRQVLIVFQFVIAIVMISGTLMMYRQLQFVLSKDLGFDKEQVLVVSLTGEIEKKHEAFANEVRMHPDAKSVSICRNDLGQANAYSTYLVPEGFPPDEIEARVFEVDANFKDTYGIKMVMGRFFDPQSSSDSMSLLINEAMMRRLKWEDPTKKTIKFRENQRAWPVIGVIKDFYFKPLYENVEPLVMKIATEDFYALSVRFEGKNTAGLLQFLEQKWKAYEKRYPFNYFFVDQGFARMYQSEQKLFKTVITFGVISLIIACLGLYGLISFILEQRTKELGIRKVLGATVANLTFLVNRKFIMLVLISGLLAVPVSYRLVEMWLKKFAFHVDMAAAPFVGAIVLTLAITVFSVCIQALKSALANPVDALRHE